MHACFVLSYYIALIRIRRLLAGRLYYLINPGHATVHAGATWRNALGWPWYAVFAGVYTVYT